MLDVVESWPPRSRPFLQLLSAAEREQLLVAWLTIDRAASIQACLSHVIRFALSAEHVEL